MEFDTLLLSVKALCKEKGVTQKIAYEQSGVGKNFATNIKQGSKPSIDKLEALAQYFNVSVDTLMGKTEKSEPSNIRAVLPGSSIHQIPLYESVSAGFGAYASNDVLDYIPALITNPADVDDTIGIIVNGDSMEPKIEDGDTIIVRKQTSVDSGTIAVVLLDGDEGLVKRVVYGPTWIELQSLNEKYPPQRFKGEEVTRLRVVGKVLQIIKSL